MEGVLPWKTQIEIVEGGNIDRNSSLNENVKKRGPYSGHSQGQTLNTLCFENVICVIELLILV